MKVLDSSCIICLLTEIQEPIIILNWRQQGYSVVIPLQVYEEIRKNSATLTKVTPYLKDGTIKIVNQVTAEDIQKFQNRYLRLGKGEISVILTSIEFNKQKKKYYAAIDEKIGRKIAYEHKVNLTGTFGLILALKEKDLISEEQYASFCEKIKKSKFRINIERLENEHRIKSKTN